MDWNTPEHLIQALRDCGLYSPAQLAILDELSPELIANPVALSERLRAAGLLTGYQTKKVRISRIVEILIGPYLVMDKIGEGGMGKVYKAIQLKVGLVVALKVVRPHLLSNKTVMRRYKREAAAAATLNHVNIVSLHDANEADGRHYMAMEFVNGSDLARLVKEFGQLHYCEVAEYGRQTALGLQHAHDREFVHRDIKPSNLLVSGERALPKTGGVAHIKILDMGLIRSLSDDDDVSRTELTRDGTVVGTPDYMSPEQAKNSSTVDSRADIYSLGCTLYYLLAGRPPFPEGSPIDKLLRHQLDAPPDLRKIRPDAPYDLVRIIDKLLAKKPEDRIQTCTEIAAQLARFTPDAAPEPEMSLEGEAYVYATPAATGGASVPDGTTVVTLAVNAANIPEAEIVTAPMRSRKTAKAIRVVAVPEHSDGNLPSANAVRIPKPRHPDHSSGTIPTTVAGATTNADIDDSKETRRNRPLKAKPVPAKKPKPKSQLPMFAAIGGALLLLIVGTVVVLKPGTKPPETTQPIPVATKPIVVEPVKGILVPASWNLPESTTAAMVVHPEAYMAKWKQSIQPKSVAAINNLAARYRFDVRKCERIMYAIVSDTGFGSRHYTTAEGDFLNANWIAELDRPAFAPKAINGQKCYSFASPNNQRVIATVIGERAYALGSDGTSLVAMAQRSAQNKPPASVSDKLLAALPDPLDANRPFATFVATGRWAFPDGDTLSRYGIEFLVVRVRLAEDRFHVDIELTGKNEQAIQNFTSIGLYKKIEEHLPAIKPFVLKIASNESSREFEPDGNQVRMKISGDWEPEDAHDWFEKLIGEK